MAIELSNVFVFLATLAFGFLLWCANYLFDRSQTHETRIQTIENIQGTKLDQLEKKIDKIELSIETLAANIHKEKNTEMQLSNAITLLYNYLEKNERDN
jgi:septal ring factor EnvC (AmiA/AmiB activator)